jgi:predicted secreted hydrolase
MQRFMARGGQGLAGMVLCALLVVGCGVPGVVAPGSALKPLAPTPTTAPLPPVRLPQDEGPHTDLTEWWYYTGHLQGTDAQGQTHTYGFELTFFQILRGNVAPVYVGHYAVTDLTRGAYHNEQIIQQYPTVQTSAHPGFSLAIGAWTMTGLGGQDTLDAAMTDYAIALTLQSAKAGVALHNGNGLLENFGLGFSYYYSRTHMNVSGTMTDHGQAIAVTGLAWMDHQWGNFLIGPSISWDWFSLQLADNTEYMLFFLHDRQSNQQYYGATRIAPDGTSTPITTGLAEVALGSWTSPTTHITYSSGWRLSLPGGSVTVTPLLANQEFVVQSTTAGTSYWEGDSAVTGTLDDQAVTGQAYVELTGAR